MYPERGHKGLSEGFSALFWSTKHFQWRLGEDSLNKPFLTPL